MFPQVSSRPSLLHDLSNTAARNMIHDDGKMVTGQVHVPDSYNVRMLKAKVLQDLRFQVAVDLHHA